jgi:uncharacterized protein (TIGR00255 family)
MTGFSFLEKQKDNSSITIEIRSYNSRFLEIFCNLPSALAMLEPRIRECISQKCSRGKIDVSVRLKNQNTNFSVSLNKNALFSYIKNIKLMQQELQKEMIINSSIPLETFCALEGIFEIEKDNIDCEEAWRLICGPFDEALEIYEKERMREGEYTKTNIVSLLQVLEDSLEIISSKLPLIEASIKTNITNRFHELSAEDIDENRILAETAVMLMKYTIAEEVSRLRSHFSVFHAEILNNEKPGKKLDFLCQEINREINTMGSKTPLIEVSRCIVEMKDALENIREQLRNVE